ARLAVEHVGAPADGALAAREEEVDGEVVLVDGDVRRGARRLAEGADHLAPGRVGGVQDAPLRVPALAPEVVLVVVGVAAQVEVRAEREQVALDGHGPRASRARPAGSSGRHPGRAQRIDLAEGVPYRRR